MKHAPNYAAAALLCALIMLGIGAAAQGARDGEVALRAAMETETVKGDLKGAIEQYRKIADGRDRALAAQALVRMADCYQKLGDAQARQIFEQVVRDYTDQKDAVAIARTRLTALAQQSASAPSPARRLVVDWQTAGPYALPTRDGRSLVRYNTDQRTFELVEIGSGQVRPLLTQGPNPDQAAVRGGGHIHLSNDGRKLAAVVGVRNATPAGAPSTERLELRVFDVGGRGDGRALANWNSADMTRFGVRIFAWSPRDDRIWVWIMKRDQTAQIAWVDLSGKVQTLKTLTWRDHSQPPSLSPDGRFVAYHDAADRQALPDIYIIASDGSREHRVEHPANDNKPMFTPDSAGVIFESDRRGSRDLWFVAVTDGRPARTPRLIWRNVSPYGQAERFGDNGSLFYWFATNDWSTYTLSLDLDSVAARFGEPVRLAPVLNEVNTGPAFSPDGRQLAYFRASGRRSVVRELTTGREREIPFQTALGTYATADWCANSDVLIVSGYAPGIGYLTYRVSVNDSSVQPLPIDQSPVFCVGRGDEVIGLRNDPSGAPAHAIVRRSMAAGSETVLFNENRRVSALARAFDGSRLAFVVHDKDAARLVTMPAGGGAISSNLMITGYFGEANDRRPLIWAVGWMPDGQRLLVVRYDDEAAGSTDWSQRPLWLWDVPLDGRAPRKLGVLPLPKVEGNYFAGIGSFTIHPDGKQLAFHSHEGYLEQTWAIDNLVPFIKASAAP